MGICFVIQPFDGGRFDKRYDDVFVPAIQAAGLEPYRTDRDPAVTIPIEQVEEGIRRADVCLADISTNNPNVWFELGYAIAAGKPVILVHEHQPDHRYPFDIQHRTIISYKTESPRDFDTLKTNITVHLQAVIAKGDTIERVAESSPIAKVEGLSQHEIVALATIAANISAPDDIVSSGIVRQDMERVGFTRVAITIALNTLLRKKLIETGVAQHYDGEPYTAYSLTEKGMSWLIDNQDRLVLRQEQKQSELVEEDDLVEDEIPF